MKNKKGFTLVELMLAIAILSFIVPVMVTLLNTTMEGFTAFDANQQLKTGNQKLLNNIYSYLSQNERIFQNTAADIAFLNKVDTAGCPAVAAGSLLPTINASASLSPNTTSFLYTGVGNSLFFGGISETKVLTGITGTTRSYTVGIDCYRFFYYYLTAVYTGKLVTTTSYNVYRWESKLYADYTQINSMALIDATKKSNTIKALYAAGVIYAWDTSQTAFASAFYNLTSGGAANAAASQLIQKDTAKSKMMINLLVGKTGRGFKYGISPNSSVWTDAPKTVPKFAHANGAFPGGFEVVVVGPTGGRKVLIRSVLVAQGARKIIPSHDMSLVISAKDLW